MLIHVIVALPALVYGRGGGRVYGRGPSDRVEPHSSPHQVLTAGAGFDGYGVLWLLTAFQFGVPEFINLIGFQVTDLEAGDYEESFNVSVPFADARFDMRTLAVPTTLPAVDVPAVDGVGLVVLSLGLLGVGLAVLRRRRRPID